MTRSALLNSAALVALLSAAPLAAQDVQNDAGEDAAPKIVFGDEVREDYILVSAHRDGGLQVDEYPGSATIVNRDDMSRRQVRDVADVLRDVPGVAISSVAGQTQLRLRGAEGNHVLVLVDGIEVSDPFAGEFDLGTLQAEIGSYVEVLRGPQSALYGSDAVGGVVAYRSGEFAGLAGRIEAGTNETVNGALRFGTGGSGWDISLSGTVVSTGGEPNARGGTRDIGRDGYTLAGKGSVELTENFTLRAVGRYVVTEGEFNDSDFDTTSPAFGFTVDSPGTRYENEALYALAGAELYALDGKWRQDLSFQFADIRRDSFGPFGRSFGNEGERLKASYVTAYAFGGSGLSHTLTFATDWEEERYRNTDPFGFAFTGTRSNENVGLVGEYRLSSNRFNVAAAIRRDINEGFADATTFKLAAGVPVTDTTRLRGAIGTGIKNPGFYELYGFVDGRFIGNANLKPERATEWEVGVEQDLFDQDLMVSVTFFDSVLDNEIITTYPAPTFVATPDNAATQSNRKGLEASLSAFLGRSFSLKASYTYLDAEENGVTEVRRPKHVASAALDWRNTANSARASLVVRHNGAADDLAFTDPSYVPVRVTLDDYTLVNLYGEVDLAEGLSVFARAENLFDERYEQVFSFVSPGRQLVAGFSASF